MEKEKISKGTRIKLLYKILSVCPVQSRAEATATLLISIFREIESWAYEENNKDGPDVHRRMFIDDFSIWHRIKCGPFFKRHTVYYFRTVKEVLYVSDNGALEIWEPLVGSGIIPSKKDVDKNIKCLFYKLGSEGRDVRGVKFADSILRNKPQPK